MIRAAATCPGSAIMVEPALDANMAVRQPRRVIIVGASLAGLRAAEALLDFGYTGALTIVGDEPYGPTTARRSPSRC